MDNRVAQFLQFGVIVAVKANTVLSKNQLEYESRTITPWQIEAAE